MITYRLENSVNISMVFKLASFLLANEYIIDEDTEICQNYIALYMRKDSQSIYIDEYNIRFDNFTPCQSVELFERLMNVIEKEN